MTKPAQQPPGTCGQGPAAGVINNHVGSVTDSQPAKRGRKRIGTRQRMAASIRADRRSQIPIEVGENGSGNVPLQIGASTGTGIGKVESTIDYPQIRIIYARMQLMCINQVADVSHPYLCF
jgi:hypothetical protein